MKPYYYVFTPGGSAPTLKHATQAEAVAESLRLAKKHLGQAFEVLKCVAISQTSEASTFWVDGEGSEPEWRYFRSNLTTGVFRRWNGTRMELAAKNDPTWEYSVGELTRVESSHTEIPASELPPEINP